MADCDAEFQLPEGFDSDVVEASDPQRDEICYKDGATTERSFAGLGATETRLFIKRTADMAHRGKTPDDMIGDARVAILQPVGSGPVAQPGDSGGGVLCPAEEKNGWTWTGMVASGFYPRYGNPQAAFMIAQSQIFASLEEATGKTWRLAGHNLQN